MVKFLFKNKIHQAAFLMILNIDKSLIWSIKMQINESNLQSSGIFRFCKEN